LLDEPVTGYTTERISVAFGSFRLHGRIVIVIAPREHVFIRLTALTAEISAIGVIVFVGP